jgi:hypothetical protein
MGAVTSGFCEIQARAAGQPAAGEGAPGDYPDLFSGAQRHHFAFFFAVQQVVVVLHADERGPTVLPGEMQGFAELPGEHR